MASTRKFKKGTGLPVVIPHVFKLRVKPPDKPIIRRLMAEGFRRALQEAYTVVAASMEDEIKEKFVIKAHQSPEYLSMMNGALRGHFGFEFPEALVEPIVMKAAEHITVLPSRVKIIGRKFIGGLNIFLLREDFVELLGMSEASYVSPPSGETVSWLEWLLVGGVTTQVHTHGIKFGKSDRSRSGKAIMEKGGSWGMGDTSFAGSKNNNWLTRVFDNLDGDINTILLNELSHVI